MISGAQGRGPFHGESRFRSYGRPVVRRVESRGGTVRGWSPAVFAAVHHARGGFPSGAFSVPSGDTETAQPHQAVRSAEHGPVETICTVVLKAGASPAIQASETGTAETFQAGAAETFEACAAETSETGAAEAPATGATETAYAA